MKTCLMCALSLLLAAACYLAARRHIRITRQKNRNKQRKSTMNKILFVLKRREGYGGQYSHGCSFSSGLYNSALLVVNMLNERNPGCAVLVEVVDNNEIDAQVSMHRPDTVIIEALWVVPDKFDVLHQLHPSVDWIIRLHSDTPFLAGEGIAMDWLFRYSRQRNVRIAANSVYAVGALSKLLDTEIIYLPNYYPIFGQGPDPLHIGCFGAVRPMKNHLTQAIAAIEYANETGRQLHFHINASRVEHGENNLKNLRAIFDNVPHLLIEHGWLQHDEFLALVRTMDIGMQVSLSETYNIVAADFISQGVPIVASNEIEFVARVARVENTKDVAEIVAKLRYVEQHRYSTTRLNRLLLHSKSHQADRDWAHSLNSKL